MSARRNQQGAPAGAPKPPEEKPPEAGAAAPSSEPAGAPSVEAPETKRDEAADSGRLLVLMRKPVFRTWLAKHHEEAQKVLRVGPGGSGWRFNETARQDAEDFAEALALLRKAIDAAP